MAKNQGLTLKDLIEKQREYAATGNKNAIAQLQRLEEMQKSVEQQAVIGSSQEAKLEEIRDKLPPIQMAEKMEALAKQDRLLQVAQVYEESQINKDEDKALDKLESIADLAKKGLVDKNGDGLNANIIKLVDQIKDSSSSNNMGDGRPSAANKKQEAARLEIQAKQSASQFKQGGFASLAGQMSSMKSLKGWFDLSGPATGTMLDKAIRRKVDKNEMVESRMIANPNMRNLAPYQTAEVKELKSQLEQTTDPAKRAALTAKIKQKQDAAVGKGLGAQYEKQQAVRGQQVETERKIELLKSRGMTDDEIKASGLLKKRTELDDALAGVDVKYKNRRDADRAAVSGGVEPAVPVVKPKRGNKSAVGPIEQAIPVSAEQQGENLRMMQEQNNVLKQIEENTRQGGGKSRDATNASQASAPSEPPQSGGILQGIADFAQDGLLGKSKYLGKLGGLARVAKGVGVGGIASLAGEGIQAGGDMLKEAGYEQTGKAVAVGGTATKYAGYGAMIGSVVPGVGTAIGAGVGGLIGAGKGIYDQYFAAQPTAVTADNIQRAQVADIPAPRGGDIIYNQSSNNAAAAQVPAQTAPVIISAPSSTNVSTTQNIMDKGIARNPESSWQSYNKSRYAY